MIFLVGPYFVGVLTVTGSLMLGAIILGERWPTYTALRPAPASPVGHPDIENIP